MSPDEKGLDVGRDRELGDALAVAPLDDVTRRRLVRVALEQHASPLIAPTGRRRMLTVVGVAAALLVGVVVGTAVVTRPEAPTTPNAAGAGQSEANKQAAERSPDAAAPAGASVVPAQALGDLGAATDIQGLVRAVDVRLQSGRSSEAEDAANAFAQCADAAVDPLVLISAAGAATLGGRPVVVRVGTAPSGDILVVALDALDCTVVATAPVP